MTTFRKASSLLNWKPLQAAAVFLLCSTLLACFGATPLPKRIRTPEGTEVKKVDLGRLAHSPGWNLLRDRREWRESLEDRQSAGRVR